MCRIYGYLGKGNVSPETLQKIAASQMNGGPDEQHFKISYDWALGNNRLAIQGLSGGLQPFHLNKMTAVYNGEIYNHKELKKYLSTRGYTFHDDCDGAVILPLYELYGDDFVKHLNGMFAIAIVDERQKRKLILTTDPSSVKSVYYYWDKTTDSLYFASELPSLLLFPVVKDLRLEAIDEFITGRSIWHNKTFYKNIQSLGPSSFLVKEMDSPLKLSHYESNLISSWHDGQNFENTSDYFNHLLEEEMSHIIQADVPVCVVTSGGLDSSYVTAMAARHIKKLHCFNVAYEGNWPSDERAFAKEVSDHYGATYHQVLIKENEFQEILKKTILHLGQPNSAPHSLSTYALFKAINDAGFKVAITGEGADEFFGGYERFRKAVFSTEPEWLDQYFDTMCATTREMRDTAYSSEYQQYLRDGNGQLLKRAKNKILSEIESSQSKSRLRALLNFDQKERFPSYILRRVDHLSMANSVEVRVPFCQPKLSHLASVIPDDFLLNQSAVKRVIYQGANNKLPQSVLTRPKQPFTLPITAMLKKGFVLFDILYETLNSNSFKARGVFNQKNITMLINRQLEKPSNATADVLWSIMMLELWLQHSDSKLSL